MSTDRRRHAPTSRVRTWLLPSLLAGILAAAGCHDLELSQLRCSLAGRCPSGYACGADGFCRRQSDNGRVAGPPGSKKQGEACASADECVTHACTDGVCCDTGCGDACHACNLPDNVGTCVAVARGSAPVHDACETQSPQSCGTNGLCDGDGHCAVYDATTVCGDASCDKGSNAFVHEAHCDGFGACAAAGAALSCAPFMCRPDGKGCADRCGSTSECVAAKRLRRWIVRSDRQRSPLPRRQPVPVRLLRRRRVLQRALHGTVHGLRSDRVARNVRAGPDRQSARRALRVRRRRDVVRRTVHGRERDGLHVSGRQRDLPQRELRERGRERLADERPLAATAPAAAAPGSPRHAGSTCARQVASARRRCAGDFDCAAGYICQGGSCQAKGVAAAPCTATSQCAAGLTCKDGVCCESACADSCRTCNAAGQAGHCVVVASADDPDSCPADTRTLRRGRRVQAEGPADLRRRR